MQSIVRVFFKFSMDSYRQNTAQLVKIKSIYISVTSYFAFVERDTYAKWETARR